MHFVHTVVEEFTALRCVLQGNLFSSGSFFQDHERNIEMIAVIAMVEMIARQSL